MARRNPRDAQPGYIYIIQHEGVAIFKIGLSIDPARRLMGIRLYAPAIMQRSLDPRKLQVIHTIKTNNMAALEVVLHQKYEHLWPGNPFSDEWFTLSDQDVQWLTGIREWNIDLEIRETHSQKMVCGADDERIVARPILLPAGTIIEALAGPQEG